MFAVPRRIALAVALLALAGASSAAGAPLDSASELRGSLAMEFDTGAAAIGPGATAWFLPPVELRSVLRMVHLVGLCMGFGTAMMLDGGALAWMRARRAPANAASLLAVGGHLVLAGFGLLWASGVALTVLAVSADPSFLTSPKLWAKILVVTALTANAAVLHARVLPPFARSMGRAIDGRWRGRERALFVGCGAVSSASWVLAFALGILREWNQAAPIGSILLLWLIGMLMAAIAIQLLLPAAAPRASYLGQDRRREPAAAAAERRGLPEPLRAAPL